MTPSLKFKPFMAYLDPGVYKDMKAFSKRNRTPMSQLMREAIHARIASGDVYTLAFNAGLKAAMKITLENKASQMRFPSGKTFGELVCEDIEKLLLVEHEEPTNT
jgi:predicted DNA-binding protein